MSHPITTKIDDHIDVILYETGNIAVIDNFTTRKVTMDSSTARRLAQLIYQFDRNNQLNYFDDEE